MFAVGTLTILVHNGPETKSVSVAEPVATTSLAVVPASLPPVLPTLPLFVEPIVAPTPATSTEKTPTNTTPKPEPKPASPQPPPGPAPTPPPISTTTVVATVTTVEPPLNNVAANLRLALVNIICFAPKSAGVHSTSGSGVMIDHKGIILTNSHIAQHFLLADLGVTCKIRTGSPAKTAYTAAPIFVSSAWVKANADILLAETPSGTGEHDFALLAVTGSLTRDPLPSGFSFVPLAKLAPKASDEITIGAYPAQLLDADQIDSSLYATIVAGSIKKLFTFEKTSVDVISLGGSEAAQEGSSGGGIINTLGILIGTITTSTTEGDFSSRNINAITASYMRRDFANETGQSLDSFLTQPIKTSIENFAPRIPVLEAILTTKLAE